MFLEYTLLHILYRNDGNAHVKVKDDQLQYRHDALRFSQTHIRKPFYVIVLILYDRVQTTLYLCALNADIQKFLTKSYRTFL